MFYQQTNGYQRLKRNDVYCGHKSAYSETTTTGNTDTTRGAEGDTKMRKKHEIMKDVDKIDYYAGEYNNEYQGSTPELLRFLIEVLIDIRDSQGLRQ